MRSVSALRASPSSERAARGLGRRSAVAPHIKGFAWGRLRFVGAVPLFVHDPLMSVIARFRAWCGDHKKLVAAVVGSALALVPDTLLDPERRKWVVEMLMVYIAGQGIADHGKEAAKVVARASGNKLL